MDEATTMTAGDLARQQQAEEEAELRAMQEAQRRGHAERDFRQAWRRLVEEMGKRPANPVQADRS